MTPNNIIKFTPLFDIPFALDEETLKTLDELAAADGKTRNEILQEALDEMLAEHEIGHQLIRYLESLRESYSAKQQRWDPIKIWQGRVQEILQRLGAETSRTPTPDKAA